MLNLAVIGDPSVIVSMISVAVVSFGLGYGVRAYLKRPWRRAGFW